MKITTILSAMPFIALTTAFPHDKRQNTTACATGVHMIIARASTEAPGAGIIGAVASMVQSSVSGSTNESFVYPATLANYTSSETSGVAAMNKLITDYVAR